MGSTQLIIISVMIVAFLGLAFMLNLSIKKHEAKMKTMKKKKGRLKHMPVSRRSGK